MADGQGMGVVGVGGDSLAQGRRINQLLAYQSTEDDEYIILGEDLFEFGPAQEGSYAAEAEPTDLERWEAQHEGSWE